MEPNLNLTMEERATLMPVTRSRTAPVADVKRARLIINPDNGLNWSMIAERLPCTPAFINRWKRRFEQKRVAGLYARHQDRAHEIHWPIAR